MATAIQGHPMRDRRAASRLKVELNCRFIFEGTEHEASIKDVSLMSALLWSTVMPPTAAGISIKLETPLLNSPLILEGKIVRREYTTKEPGGMGAFAVRFNHSAHPALVALIKKLAIPQNS